MKSWLITASLCLSLLGCATPRSNTRTFKEATSLVVVDNVTPNQQTDQAAVSAIVIDVAVKAGIRLAKKLINEEAKKYEADYAAERDALIRGFDNGTGVDA